MKKKIGFNLILDIYNVESRFLKDKNFLLNLLKRLLNSLDLQPVGKPIVKKITTPGYPDYGYSIIQIIKESHIAFHTWPEYNYLAIDVFSCKFFSEEKMVKILEKELKPKEIKIKKYLRVAKWKI